MAEVGGAVNWLAVWGARRRARGGSPAGARPVPAASPAAPSRQTCSALTRWTGERSAGTRAPARSSCSLKRTAPSPAASGAASAPAASRAARSAGAIATGSSSRSSPRHAAAKTSPRRASITASTGPSPACGSAPRASASRLDTPASGSPRAWASARAVAIPWRRPVKPPGPTPTAIRSTSSQPAPARSSTSSTSASRRVAWPGRAPGSGSSRASTAGPSGAQTAAAVAAVAVSRPRITPRSSRASPPACSSRT